MKNFNKRDEMAFEIMKIHINAQARLREMTPINRIKYWLGIKGWSANTTISTENIIAEGYDFVDSISEYRKEEKDIEEN